MSQNRADSPESIYDALVGDSEFSNLVGQYKFTNESTPIDSIVISTPGAKLPHLSSQSGLEVIIHDAGQVTRMDYLTESSDALVTWKVYLIAWPPANGTTITNAAKRMIEIFANSTAIEVVSTPNELGAMVQTLVLVPENALIMV